jgi:monoamine oxidase
MAELAPAALDQIPWLDPRGRFSTWRLHSPLPDLPVGRPKKVAVIGGGIAGLAAAYELQKLRHEVVLLEAGDRVGGRILTHRFEGGYYGELGAMRIPWDHLSTWRYINDFTLPFADFVQENVRSFYYLRGRHIPVEPWEPLHDLDPDLYPNLRPRVAAISPHKNLDKVVPELMQHLPEHRDRWEAFASNLTDRRIARLDRMSIWQHVSGLAAPTRASWPAALRLAEPAPLRDEEWEYVGRGTGMLWDEKVAFLEGLVDTVPFHFPFMFRIDGGMELLPRAFQERLGGIVQLGCKVDAIDWADHPVVHWTKNGETASEPFEYVVVAVPAAATTLIRYTPSLPSWKYEALTNLTYQAAAKSLVLCSSRRWEQERGIFGGGTFTDLPIQQVWYPSDNARLAAREDEEYPPEMAVISRPDGSTSDVPKPREWRARDERKVDEPAVLTAAYMWGTNARRFSSMPEADRDALVLRCLEDLYPGIRGDVIGRPVHWSWDQKASPGGGGWASFRPGERDRYQLGLVAPIPSDRPRIFFAGEHLGIEHAWIQSAIQTAHAAVWHIHFALG